MNTDFSSLPYDSFSEIRIRSNEPMSYAYFNTHIARLYSDIESMASAHTIQKATVNQWGVVKKASIDDFINDEGNKDSVITNEKLNDVIDYLKQKNQIKYLTSGKLDFTRNYEFQTGEFILGINENIAKKITSSPDNVVYVGINYTFLGFDNKPFFTTRTDTVAASSYSNIEVTNGVINFASVYTPEEYREFHIYYHKDGYIICRNGKYDDNQKQVRVTWNMLRRKDVY